MLEVRKPSVKPDGATPIVELTEQVAAEVGIPPQDGQPVTDEGEEYLPGWATFKKDAHGLYFEGRAVRAHLKDAALQVQNFFPAIKNFRSKVVNRLYVLTDKIFVGKEHVDGTEHRFVQVMTRQGPRSAEKYIDFVEKPQLVFVVSLLNDGVITEEHLKVLLEYGAIHGLGQERSQGWGRYSVSSIQQVEKV